MTWSLLGEICSNNLTHSASSTFPDLASTDMLFNTKLAKMLYASVTEKLVTIVPQPEDYSKVLQMYPASLLLC
jgi:hypothetical protein